MVTVTQHQDTLNAKTCQAKLLTTYHNNRHAPADDVNAQEWLYGRHVVFHR
jgi:hypothetical protein